MVMEKYCRTGESGTRYSSIRSEFHRCLRRDFLSLVMKEAAAASRGRVDVRNGVVNGQLVV